LLAQYEDDLGRILASASRSCMEGAVSLAGLPEQIRGFGHVREAHSRRLATQREAPRAALARRFATDGAAGVVVADRDGERAEGVARSAGPNALALRCDVSRESEIQALVAAAQERFGRVDVFVSNAGILGPAGGVEIEDAVWDAMWKIHVMAHVWAARAVLPGMLARGDGYFLVTASAAGLLNIVETAPYGVTKHSAVGFAEWLRIAYGRRGLRVSCLCP